MANRDRELLLNAPVAESAGWFGRREEEDVFDICPMESSLVGSQICVTVVVGERHRRQ